MFCQKCGEVIDSNAVVCQKCGVPTSGNSSPQYTPENPLPMYSPPANVAPHKQKKFETSRRILSALIVIVDILIIILLFTLKVFVSIQTINQTLYGVTVKTTEIETLETFFEGTPILTGIMSVLLIACIALVIINMFKTNSIISRWPKSMSTTVLVFAIITPIFILLFGDYNSVFNNPWLYLIVLICVILSKILTSILYKMLKENIRINNQQPVYQQPVYQQPVNQQNNDVSEKIRKLSELHSQGILTDNEYETKKQALLDNF